MNGYRYWVERHKLLVELERQKEVLAERPEKDRPGRATEIERAFRGRLDALYGEARAEFEVPRS